MSIETKSATPLEEVTVEHAPNGVCSDVWLRKNIMQDAADNGSDGTPFEFWCADEVHFVAPGTPSVTEVSAAFDALWALHKDDDLTDHDRIDTQEAVITDLQLAVVDIYEATLGGAK